MLNQHLQNSLMASTGMPVLPQFKVVVIDETHFWSEEIQARVGKVFQAYLFDSNRHVYCCELTPSYELYPLYATATMDDSEGELDGEMRAAADNEVTYAHVRSIDGLPAGNFHVFSVETEAPESWDELLAEYQERCQGTTYIQTPHGFITPA